MKLTAFIFIKIPRKIVQTLFTLHEYLYYRFTYSGSKIKTVAVPKRYILFGGRQFDKASEHFTQVFPGRAENMIHDADLICDHYFDILGSSARKLSRGGDGYKPIEWHSDFKSGYHWDAKIFYRNVRYGHREGVDIKVPFELSRFQHLNMLGQAYVLTGYKKYRTEVIDQISDWIENNSVGFGVNWTCAMDIAIRTVNWLTAMEHFAYDEDLPDGFIGELYSSVYDHGKFIRSHLEYVGKWTTNHYLADITGLFFISVYCPFFKESKDWQEFAVNELHKEIEKQVYSDGCSFESSTSYHRLALEMFFYCALLGRRAGIGFTEDYNNRLRKMFEFSLYCIKPNGMIPQIGDNDSGRLLKFSNRDILDHKYLSSLAAGYFDDGMFMADQSVLDEEAFWVFGTDKIRKSDHINSGGNLVTSKSFELAGWHIIRHESDYCFISCGPNGGEGWHSHNDKLSFELVINGYDVIVDPGTYVYTSFPEERNKFRSTAYHNTIMFEGYEQNDIPEKGMFSLPDKVQIVNTGLSENDDKISFQGEISYKGITHKRTITLSKDTSDWQIIDIISCPSPLKARLLFHLSPYVITNGNVLLTKDRLERIATIEVQGYELNKEEYDYSPEYGVKLKAECLTAHFQEIMNNQTIITHVRSLM